MAGIKIPVGTDNTGLNTGVAAAQKKLALFKGTVVRGFVAMAAAFGGMRLGKSILGLGLAAAETASKFLSVFGPAADEMNKKLRALMDTIPATSAELQDITATLRTMLEAMGVAPAVANDLSLELVKLSGDVASFNNMRPEEVFLKMRAAISGEFEPMKALGIVINEARINQEALNLGISDGTTKLSASQKALVVYNLLMADTVKMQGDAAATADTLWRIVGSGSTRLSGCGVN